MKKKDEFSNINNNFKFKVIIFYNIYKQVKLLPNIYIYSIFFIFSGQNQMYYSNYSNTSNFAQFYINMQLFFEDPKWQYFNLIK